MNKTKKRILVFSDFDSIRNLIVKTLTSLGYEVINTNSIEEATEKLNGLQYGLIITDNDAQNNAALQLISQLRDLTSYLYTPVMLLHSHSKEQIKDKYEEFNIACYLNKPFDMQGFKNIVSRLA